MLVAVIGVSLWLALGFAAAEASSLEHQEEQCEQTGSSAVSASNLLQIDTNSIGQEDSFGPGRCVGLKKSVAGSCIIRTRCDNHNISDTEFAFVCFNPGASMPHALHSFGRGGFAKEETFDTKVRCKSCVSVDTAWRTGDSVVKNALAALPLSSLPALSGAVKADKVYSAHELAEFKPKEAAVYGPSYCISTFLAPAGTCLIRTRCADIDLSTFNVGVTCLDKAGGYTRYLFGKDTFKTEETFDTLVKCQKCLGVGPESSLFAMHGLIPRKLVEDVSSLKTDVQTLNQKVRVLQDFSSPDQPSKKHEKSEFMSEIPNSAPTIMMSRRQSPDLIEKTADLSQPLASTGDDSGAETAAMNVGPVEMVSHRRGAALAELLKRATK